MSQLDLATTAIGSLPHHNVDAALDFSFRLSIPFLPQIPIRNPWEYMLPQALDGLPGLGVEEDGSPQLTAEVWSGRSAQLNEKLLKAFAGAAAPDAFQAFEPSSSTSSAWQPFLWELGERGVATAKIQIAGPLTAQWALKGPDLGMAVYRLVLARALAMTRRLQAEGVQPLLYLDEPGLFAFDPSDPRHVIALQELKLVVQALRKEGVIVGLHCCSNTHWPSVLALGLDVLSLDSGLSLGGLLAHTTELETFTKTGGRLSLGVIPTSGSSSRAPDPARLWDDLGETLDENWKGDRGWTGQTLARAIYTPACGLALHSVAQAEGVLEALRDFRELARAQLEAR
jgi:hypothetical protein